LDDYEYRRVKVKGTFRHDQEMLVGPRTRGDGVVGYFLITPLQREDGSVILVKRGWVALDKKDKRNRPDSLVTGPVEVEGLLRLTEQVCTYRFDWTLISFSLFGSQTRLHLTMIQKEINGIGWI
jgi:cytochrome oxidase assembly protein ShyY1